MLNEAEARVAKVYPDLNVTTELLVDDPVPTLVAEAARAEMLVLGSRGYGTLTGYLVGSVSLQVLRQATGPVVMVRGPRQTTVQQRFDEVVVGVQEAGEAGGPVLEFAFAAAAERGATLRAVRAWSIPSVLSWSPGSMWLADQAGGLEPLHKEILADALGPARSTPMWTSSSMPRSAQPRRSCCPTAAARASWSSEAAPTTRACAASAQLPMPCSTMRRVRSRSYRTPDTARMGPRALLHRNRPGRVPSRAVRLAAVGQSWATTATGDAACSMTAWVTWPMCGPQRTAPDATGRHTRSAPRRPPTAAA